MVEDAIFSKLSFVAGLNSMKEKKKFSNKIQNKKHEMTNGQLTVM